VADQVDGPVAGTELAAAWVESVARLAYVWGWPMVSQLNRRMALTSVDEPGLRGGSLPNAPAGQVCMMTDSPHRLLRPAGQAVWHPARFFPAGRAELGRPGAGRDQRGFPVFDGTGGVVPAGVS